jgi:phage terminase large subunit-like protein
MNSYLVEYYEKCKTGEIIIGRELMTQLQILIDDMQSPMYKFDPTEAHKRIKFIERECKHSISPFAGKPFILELWQKALIEALYGFYMEIDEQWLRRFNEVLLVIGRKNGKSSFCSALALAEFFCGNPGTNIMCASNDYEQAGILFDEINNMREESTRLDRVSRKNIKGIFMGNPKQRKKKGKFSRQNKAQIKKLSARTGGKEGRNLDVAIADEVHEMKDNSLIMPLKQSMSTKDEALFIEITTEGFTQDGYLDGRLKEARQALKDEIYRPRWLIWLYTQDNEMEIWQNRGSWVKSNPNLGVAKKWHYLDGIMEQAKTSTATRAYMLAKDFNIKQSAAQAWLPLTVIVENNETFDIKDFSGCFYISGNDFAETTDLCASKLLLKRPDDKRIYFYSHYWIPESKLKDAPDDVDYMQWARDGHITIVPGNSVDTSIVADWHYELLRKYDLKPFKSGYDNRYAKDFVRQYKEIFGDDVAINIPQDFKVLNNPMRTLEADFKDKLVNYQNNPIDQWCFKNTGVVVDKFGRQMPCKMVEKKRIDGTSAAIIAYAALEWHKSEFMALVA